ncbi:MAG: hypothetical protein HYZ81_21695 [Nitrospinae bacterium]|nr:hypothetical protein [Nitrospinota bacterium]
MNLVALMGYSAVRQDVLCPEAAEREASVDETAQMQAIVREGLPAGAYGVSFNHNPGHVAADGRPIPCRLANFQEVLAIASVLRGSRARLLQISGNPNPEAPQGNARRVGDAAQHADLCIYPPFSAGAAEGGCGALLAG